MLWAGQYTVLEINQLADDAPDQAIDSPDLSEMLPVFSVTSTDDIQSQYNCESVDCDLGRITCVRDRDGNWVGFLEAESTNILAHAELNQTLEMPSPIIALNHIILRSDDPESQAGVYQSLFGNEKTTHSNDVNIGMSTRLHFLAGQPKRLEPQDRSEVQRVFIPRIYGFSTFVDKADSMGLTLVNAMVFDGGHLNYYLDTAGQLFGFQERKAYDPDVLYSQSIEDKLARDHYEAQFSEAVSSGQPVAI